MSNVYTHFKFFCENGIWYVLVSLIDFFFLRILRVLFFAFFIKLDPITFSKLAFRHECNARNKEAEQIPVDARFRYFRKIGNWYVYTIFAHSDRSYDIS